MKINHFKKFLNVFCVIYLLKLYSVAIIMLLINNVTNICSEITKIWMNLWMVHTGNMKRLQEVEKMGRKWMHFASLTKTIRDLRFKQTIQWVYRSMANRWEIHNLWVTNAHHQFQEKWRGNYCLNLKKSTSLQELEVTQKLTIGKTTPRS